MDQIKIGKFISEKRKENNITQSELAERLNITDRAISKWERGICLPDASNIIELCKILNISINDLFSGEIVDMKDNEKKLEDNLIEMTKLKEQADKQLLSLEVVIGVLISLILMSCVFLAAFLDMPDNIRVIVIICGIIPFAIGMYYTIKIEQVAGYYKCPNCDHKYVPTYKSVLFAQHINRTRKLKCPKCGKKGWHKKVL